MHTTADGTVQIAWGLSHYDQDDKVTVEHSCIPKLAGDIIAKLQLHLDNTTERIWWTRSKSEAVNIIQSLQKLIDSYKQVVFNPDIVGVHFLLHDYFDLFI